MFKQERFLYSGAKGSGTLSETLSEAFEHLRRLVEQPPEEKQSPSALWRGEWVIKVSVHREGFGCPSRGGKPREPKPYPSNQIPNRGPSTPHPVENLPQEGEHYDFISEHHILWEAGVKEDWEKICEVIDSQLRPMSLKRLGEQNYRRLGWHLQFSKVVKAGWLIHWPPISLWLVCSCFVPPSLIYLKFELYFALDDGKKNIKTHHTHIIYTRIYTQIQAALPRYHIVPCIFLGSLWSSSFINDPIRPPKECGNNWCARINVWRSSLRRSGLRSPAEGDEGVGLSQRSCQRTCEWHPSRFLAGAFGGSDKILMMDAGLIC